MRPWSVFFVISVANSHGQSLQLDKPEKQIQLAIEPEIYIFEAGSPELIFQVSHSLEFGLTPHDLTFIDDLKNVAGFGDAEHRGKNWYDYDSRSSGESGSDLKSRLSEDTSSITSGSSISSSGSSEASSVETNEKRRATKTYRTCTPCPRDMIKKYSNFGIKWICGGYQRARRSFKSECMMRYRNCQDGTMFVKLYDRRCKDDPAHGRHWFYVYKV